MSKNKTEPRFQFGQNWQKYLANIDEEKVKAAKKSIEDMLCCCDLTGKSFLDIGSGSGLFSLSARMMGANVVSFDYDLNSVYCTNELKKAYFSEDADWVIMQGDVLDKGFMSTLGKFDMVYSWGVLHHTGDMWSAIDNTLDMVSHDGKLYIALYNDQGWKSKYWRWVKYRYSRYYLSRPFFILLHLPYPFLASLLWRLLTGRLQLNRGMTYWVNYIDWLGGYPFEVSRPELVIQYIENKGFVLEKKNLCGNRSGCNEFVFRKMV